MDSPVESAPAVRKPPGPSADIILRCDQNPLIALMDLPFRCSDIWNAGVTKFEDEILLLITVEALEGNYSLYLARSNDGLRFTVDDTPLMAPLDDGAGRMYESVGIRDPRITRMDDTYYITYTANGEHGMRVGIARTTDFCSVERMGYVSQVDVKNGALLPKKINGRYALLKRPDAGMSIWLAYSRDLEFWGDEQAVMTPRGGFWDSHRIGVAGPPIEVEEGWLLIYYGSKHTTAGPLVRLGATILDRDDPSRVLARSNIPILAPRERYERIGDVPNVVFSCGALCQNGEVVLYYGASDSCICRGTAALRDIVATCFDSAREF